MSYSHYIDKLQHGEIVSFRPRGNSMRPVIKSGQRVTIEPYGCSRLNPKVGDIVFCRVHGNFYVHRVMAIGEGDKIQIGNAKRHINGWANLRNIYGFVSKIED